MPGKAIGEISFTKVYPMYLEKVEKKGRTKAELNEAIVWLTGYDAAGLSKALTADTNFADFFAAAPALHPNRDRITGTICGYRVEDIADPLEQQVRQLDKLVDEIAKGRPMAKVLRS